MKIRIILFVMLLTNRCSVEKNSNFLQNISAPSLTSGYFTIVKDVKEEHGLKITEEYFYTIDLETFVVTRGVHTKYLGTVKNSSPETHLHGRRFTNDIVISTVSNGAIFLKNNIEFPIKSSSGKDITDSVIKNKQKASFHFIQEVYTRSALITKNGREDFRVNSNVSELIHLVLLQINESNLDLSLFENVYDGVSEFYRLDQHSILDRNHVPI
ncbi:MAG: hypothetical protein ACRCV0_07455 [Brevinema sp.]